MEETSKQVVIYEAEDRHVVWNHSRERPHAPS